MSVSENAANRGVVLVTDIGFEHGARTAAEFLDAGWSVAVTARTVTGWFASWRENLPIASLRLSPIRRIVGRPIGFSIG